MPFVPAAECVGVKLEGVIDGQQTINDLYFRLPGGFILTDIQSLTTNLVDWFNLALTPNLSEDWTSVAVHSRGLNVPEGFIVDTSTGSVVGGATIEAAPNNVAACISFRTGFAGRSFRGRNYVPGIPNDQVNLNTLEPDWMLAVKAAYDLLLPAGTALPGGWEWVIVSRFSGVDVNGNPIPRTVATVTLVVSTLFTNAIVDSQRRRLPGRGK